jgi:hypothetical protein
MRFDGLLMAAALAVVAAPAHAEPRWLACKYTDQRGAARNFHMVFDDMRNTVAFWDGIALVEGTSTGITFQAIRTRFPQFFLTYNRNDGALSMTPLESRYGGLLHGECQRSPPPPGAPPDL